jgi:hypothetical protein
MPRRQRRRARYRAPPHDPIEGVPVQQDGARDGLQTARGRAEKLARLDGHNQLPKLVLGGTFKNGIEVIAKPTDRQPITAATQPARPSPKFSDSSLGTAPITVHKDSSQYRASFGKAAFGGRIRLTRPTKSRVRLSWSPNLRLIAGLSTMNVEFSAGNAPCLKPNANYLGVE